MRQQLRMIACFCIVASLVGAGLAAQKQFQSFSAIDLTENSIVITDFPTGRIFHVKDLSAGIEQGPTVAGLSFNGPYHFSFDAVGRIYIADHYNFRIVRMDDIFGNGLKIFTGTASDQLSNTVGAGVKGVELDSSGHFYIVGPNSGIIRINDMDGSGWTTLGAPLKGAILSGVGSLNNPKGLVFDKQGRFYVADTDNHRIVRFDDFTGAGWTTYGSKGTGPGEFYRPDSIAIDSSGRIYIEDNRNDRIVRINDMTGAGWISLGDGAGGLTGGANVGEFSGPHDLKVDKLDRIWVADTGNHRIVRMNDMSGNGWVAFGINSDQPGTQLEAPKGIQVLGLGPKLTYQSVFPQVAVGGGYKTSLIAVNTGGASANAEFAFTKPDSTPFSLSVNGVSGSTLSSNIPRMGVVRLDVNPSANLAVGYGTVRSAEDLSGSALIQTMNGNAVATEAAVAFSPPQKNFIVYIDNTNTARSGYAVANFGTANVQLTMKLRDKNGVVLHTKTIELDSIPQLLPGRQFSEFASERFPEASAGFEGSIEFSTGNGSSPGTVVADGPGLRLGAIALRYDNSSSDVFTTIPVILNVADDNQIPDAQFPPLPIGKIPVTLYFPQIADGSSYRTNLILVNTTNFATTARVEFFADDGTPLSLPINGIQSTTQTISLNGKSVTHITTDGTSSGLKAGWARVTSAIPIGGSAIFQTVIGGRIISEAGVPSSPFAPHLAMYVDSLGSTQSGAAIANPNNSKVNVTFNLRNTDGQIVASTTRTVPALGHTAQFFTELFPDSFDEFQGMLEVIAPASISAVALRYDNPNADVFAAVPVSVIP